MLTSRSFLGPLTATATCSCSCPPIALASTLPRRISRTLFVVRAQQDGNEPSSTPDAEARLEAFEASLRAKKGANVAAASRSSQKKPPGMAEWKEGQLFPDGWDDMDPFQKMNELYLGKRGLLFWSTKLATGGIITLVVAWAAFRFLGPALGLYRLANDISTPNF